MARALHDMKGSPSFPEDVKHLRLLLSRPRSSRLVVQYKPLTWRLLKTCSIQSSLNSITSSFESFSPTVVALLSHNQKHQVQLGGCRRQQQLRRRPSASNLSRCRPFLFRWNCNKSFPESAHPTMQVTSLSNSPAH